MAGLADRLEDFAARRRHAEHAVVARQRLDQGIAWDDALLTNFHRLRPPEAEAGSLPSGPSEARNRREGNPRKSLGGLSVRVCYPGDVRGRRGWRRRSTSTPWSMAASAFGARKLRVSWRTAGSAS